MKKTTLIFIGIFVGLLTGMSIQHIYADSARLIMVPEYIGSYKTIDLLQYMADLKTKEIKATQPSVPSEVNNGTKTEVKTEQPVQQGIWRGVKPHRMSA